MDFFCCCFSSIQVRVIFSTPQREHILSVGYFPSPHSRSSNPADTVELEEHTSPQQYAPVQQKTQAQNTTRNNTFLLQRHSRPLLQNVETPLFVPCNATHRASLLAQGSCMKKLKIGSQKVRVKVSFRANDFKLQLHSWHSTTDHGISTTNYGRNTANHGRNTTNHGRSTTNYSRSTTDYGISTTDYGRSTQNHGTSTTNHGRSTTNYSINATNYGRSTTNYGRGTTNYGRNTTNYGRSTIMAEVQLITAEAQLIMAEEQINQMTLKSLAAVHISHSVTTTIITK